MQRILWSVRGRNVCEICGTNKKCYENRLYNKSIFLLDLSKYVIIMYVFESMYKAKVGRLCNI